MKSELVTDRPDVELGKPVNHVYNNNILEPDDVGLNSVGERLVEEQEEHFIEYLDQLGFLNESNILILSAVNYYYYDTYDLSETDIIINLKQLNHLKRIDLFLKSISAVLPVNGKFIGCFIDNIKGDGNLLGMNSSGKRKFSHTDYIENGILSSNPLLNRFINFMDARVNRKLTGNIVRNLLKDNGYIIDNMTEINGITYFKSFKYGS